MKNPLWILNSTLALLLLAMIAFIMYSFKSMFERPPLAPLKIPPKVEALKKEDAKPKDIRLIYEENDLFGTYTPTIIPIRMAEQLPTLPRPPMPKPIAQRPKPIIQFLEPLPIKITGIIASSNEAKSQVTLVDNNTKKSESYRVGDKLFDAYIIRIFPRKIIIIRSNGQQETLFMYSDDAQEESRELKNPSWTDVVQKQSDSAYLINPSAFVARVTSLAHLIDMADLTTAFKEGKSLGIRIGNMDKTSIGYGLGFVPGDIIAKIQNIKPTTTINRMKIYNQLATLDMGSEVTVEYIRRGSPFAHTYTLFNLADPTTSFDQIATASVSQESSSPIVPVQVTPGAPESAPPPMPTLAYNNGQYHTEDIQKYRGSMHNMQKRDKDAMQQFGSRASIQAQMPADTSSSP